MVDHDLQKDSLNYTHHDSSFFQVDREELRIMKHPVIYSNTGRN
jgi:hypothetical protein